MNSIFAQVQNALNTGGPALWAIALLSVVTMAVIAWKIWRLLLAGVWSRGRAEAPTTAGSWEFSSTPKTRMLTRRRSQR